MYHNYQNWKHCWLYIHYHFRYQLLHVLSKEVINRWQGLVDDHHVYEDKLQEIIAWLGPLEENLSSLRKEDSTNNMEAKSNRLQVLLSEREQATHKLTSVTALGERLFPDTAAQGREKIRQDLREVRDRWEGSFMQVGTMYWTTCWNI